MHILLIVVNLDTLASDPEPSGETLPNDEPPEYVQPCLPGFEPFLTDDPSAE